jgi:zinc transport system ATP-binding protein
MLIVTHELQAVRGALTRIVDLNGGRIAFDGTPEEYARSQGAALSDHDGHHHDGHHHDEDNPVASQVAGPLDRASGGHGA